MLASFLLLHCVPDYILQLSADLLPFIHKRLSMFVLRSRLHQRRSGERQELIGVAGPQAEGALRAAGLPIPASPLTVAAAGSGLVIRLDDLRFEIHRQPRRTAVRDLWRQLQALARPAGTAAWQWLDIQAGVPLINEQTREEFVPQMANFEKLGAVSFRKGCYPGQEIIARTQYLGKVKRHLYRAHSASPLTAGQAIYSLGEPRSIPAA
jgi:folate-binding protein YgfZ